MNIVHVGEEVASPGLQKSIFLAGPSPREKDQCSWRPEALDLLASMKFEGAIFVPLTQDGIWLSDHELQVNWVLEKLENSTAIAFWIPRDLVNLPGFTTNVEFGLFADSGKSVLGYPTGAAKMCYLHHLAERKKIPVRHTLQETLATAVWFANEQTQTKAAL